MNWPRVRLGQTSPMPVKLRYCRWTLKSSTSARVPSLTKSRAFLMPFSSAHWWWSRRTLKIFLISASTFSILFALSTVTASKVCIYTLVYRCHMWMLTRSFFFFFEAFFMMPTQVFKLVIDSIVWAFKHTMRNISETGLTILMELFDNIGGTEVAAPFYQSYFLTLLQDLFVVLTDAFHKSGFSLQSALLLRMFNEVDSGKVQVSIIIINC